MRWKSGRLTLMELVRPVPSFSRREGQEVRLRPACDERTFLCLSSIRVPRDHARRFSQRSARFTRSGPCPNLRAQWRICDGFVCHLGLPLIVSLQGETGMDDQDIFEKPTTLRALPETRTLEGSKNHGVFPVRPQ